MAMPKKAPPRKKVIKKATTATPADELDQALIQFSDLKEQAAYLGDQVKSSQARIIELMDKREIKQHVTKSGFKRISATIIVGSRVVIDEPGLKRRLGTDMWNKITTRVLDRKKLDAYLASGEVDPNEVAAVSEEVENAAYVRLTVK